MHLHNEIERPFYGHHDIHQVQGPAWRLRPQAPAGYWTRRFMVSCSLGDVQVIRDWTAEGLLEFVQYASAELESSYLRSHYCGWSGSYVCSKNKVGVPLSSVPLPSAQEAVEILRSGVASPKVDGVMTLEKVIYLQKIKNKTQKWLATDPEKRPGTLIILPPSEFQFLGGKVAELPENIKNCILTLLSPRRDMTAKAWIDRVNSAPLKSLQQFMKDNASSIPPGGIDQHIAGLISSSLEHSPLAGVFESYSQEHLEGCSQTSIGWHSLNPTNWELALPSVVEASIGPAVLRVMTHNSRI